MKKQTGLIRRGFTHLDSDMFVCLYKSMVCPILEYGNIIRGPYYLMNKKEVETIQHRETKLVTSLQENDYGTRLMESDV